MTFNRYYLLSAILTPEKTANEAVCVNDCTASHKKKFKKSVTGKLIHKYNQHQQRSNKLTNPKLSK